MKKIFLSTILCIATIGCWADDGFTIDPLTLHEGETGTLVVNLNQETAGKYCAFQFDLYLPTGVEIVSEAGTNGNADYSGSFTLTDRKVNHNVSYIQKNGFWRIMVFDVSSGSNGSFSGTTGAILNISVKTNAQFAVGTQTVDVKNIVLTYTQDLTTSYLQNDFTYTFTGEEQSYLLGDVNNDGEVDIFDVMDVQSYIEGNIPDVFIFRAGDTDEDGDITIFDLMDIV
ncbi:MAG: dockerin type I repeat-containing protein, partial [Prevotella sp.]|nr:dockerin type I repeat-containing protein [Prevotella sp.]